MKYFFIFSCLLFTVLVVYAGERIEVKSVKLIEKEMLPSKLGVMRLFDVDKTYVVVSTDSSQFNSLCLDSSYTFVLEQIREKNQHLAYYGELSLYLPFRASGLCFPLKEKGEICLDKSTDVPFLFKIVPQTHDKSDCNDNRDKHWNYFAKGKDFEEKALKYLLDVIAKDNEIFSGLKFQLLDYYGWRPCYRIYDYYCRLYGRKENDEWNHLNLIMPKGVYDFKTRRIKGVSKRNHYGNKSVLSVGRCWEYMDNFNVCIQMFNIELQKFFYIVVVMDSEGRLIDYCIEEEIIPFDENKIWECRFT